MPARCRSATSFEPVCDQDSVMKFGFYRLVFTPAAHHLRYTRLGVSRRPVLRTSASRSTFPVIVDDASITDKSVLSVARGRGRSRAGRRRALSPRLIGARLPGETTTGRAARGTTQRRARAARRPPAMPSSRTTRHRRRNLNVNCNWVTMMTFDQSVSQSVAELLTVGSHTDDPVLT